MAIIPHNDPINIVLNHTNIKSSNRPYLGLSQIGDPCHRRLQLYHYWASSSDYNNRVQRIFDTGHRSEAFMIDDLAKAGFIVEDSQAEIIGVGGHWKGHVDGIITSKNMLAEFKTHNDKSFKDVKKLKVKKSKPTHYSQVQAYMGYLELSSCLYLAYNKNDSEYYYEIIPFDELFFEELKRKQSEIIMSDILLPRIGNNSTTWHECKMCNVRNVCFNKSAPNINCRTCSNVDILDGGKWSCGLNDKVLSVKDQRSACEMYEIGEMFK
jgi:CRISPR/Cas system-associated exonuclease Cas4 (RecB family)